MHIFPIDPAWVTVVISGLPLLYLAVWRIIHNPGISKISSALLISIAMFAAIAIGDLFAAGEVAFIMALGALLEDATTNRAKKGLKKLLTLAPTQGRRIRNGQEELIPAEQIQKGDLLRILPGETIPVDGTIVSGETSVDQSIMTGESLPVDKTTGEDVFCGTINRFGSIDITATKVGRGQLPAKAHPHGARTPRTSRPPCNASPTGPPAAGAGGSAHRHPRLCVFREHRHCCDGTGGFLPMCLVLATPTAIMLPSARPPSTGSSSSPARRWRRWGKVDTIAFDKTGTLTYGRLEVSDVRPTSDALTGEDLLTSQPPPRGRVSIPWARPSWPTLKRRVSPFLILRIFRWMLAKVSQHKSGKNIYCAAAKSICGNMGFRWMMPPAPFWINCDRGAKRPSWWRQRASVLVSSAFRISCARRLKIWCPGWMPCTPKQFCSPETIEKPPTILPVGWASRKCVQSCCQRKRWAA